MARKCFISFKTQDFAYKEAIRTNPEMDIIDKFLDVPTDSDNEDYIMQQIRNEYLSDSTVTIHLIGAKSAENFGYEEQRFIKRELSLYDGPENPRSGILGLVLPDMFQHIYLNDGTAALAANLISVVNIGDSTTIKEFHYNYHISHGQYHWAEDNRYCVMVKRDDFIQSPILLSTRHSPRELTRSQRKSE
jgi:hypothetical protein